MNHTIEPKLPKWDFRDNFITVIDDAFPEDFCDELIWFYERANSAGVTYTRKQHENAASTFKKDTSFNVDFIDLTISRTWEIYSGANSIINNHFNTYFDQYDVQCSMIVQGIKIQKTNPSEGYHIWHPDGGGDPTGHGSKRAATFIYYLNDIEEGGETEFLYQKERVKPVKGRGVWFPACYTHLHRGNPPLSNTKYILTGWLEYSE